MPSYSALLAQRRGHPTLTVPNWETICAPLRIGTVVGLRVTQEVPGGYQECDFTIPTSRVRYDVEHIQPRTQVWVFDGTEVAFYGHITQAIPQDNGEIQVTCDGAYRRLDDTRMRSVWADGDTTQLVTAPGSARKGSANVASSGNVELGFAAGTPQGSGNYLSAGDYVAVDYFLFDEATGTRDTKKIDGWHINFGHFTGTATLECRVYGMASPTASSADLLHTFTSAAERIEISDASSGNNTSPWPVPGGYRCIRVGLYANTGIAGLGNDQTIVITDFTVTTRGRALNKRVVDPSTAVPLSTNQIAADIWTQAGGTGYDVSYLLQEENPAGTGLMVTGNIPTVNVALGGITSGARADGMKFTDWSSPSEILDATSALDGYKVGMWRPTKNPPAGSTTTSGSAAINAWYRQPAELTYEPWNDLGDPNYIVRLARGAVWTPDGQPDELRSAAYVNYTTRRGSSESVFVEDTSTENRLWEQGWHVAADYTVDPSVGAPTAASLGTQFVEGARQPILSGTLTIYGDRPGSIELPGGGRLTKLSALRPGVIRIVDAKGAKAGIITAIEYTARTSSAPEQAVLTINDPAAQQLAKRTARIAQRDARSRNR